MDLEALEIEIKKGLKTLENLEDIVTIFGGARVGRKSEAYYSIMKLARKLAKNGYSIMTGGGPGIMEAANRGLVEYKRGWNKDNKKQPKTLECLKPILKSDSIVSIGLNIRLPNEQEMNPYVEVPLEFQNFFSRKLVFNYNSTAFIVALGGFGTLDELSEVLVQIAIGKHKKIPIILYDKSYWRGFMKWLKCTMLEAGAISKEELKLIQVASSPKKVLKILQQSKDKG
ncbi:TIGR00730 family Rossman fold protein [uncultured Helicobacter sp.]|uniref:LOG family protein n=1 Tax=uncultured Helicobacter sp. TaxID=175537 RepID=UPI002612A8BF|nr:TIGR00730 family Rossman fold protein [uncultured Helicobacter sp.]